MVADGEGVVESSLIVGRGEVKVICGGLHTRGMAGLVSSGTALAAVQVGGSSTDRALVSEGLVLRP